MFVLVARGMVSQCSRLLDFSYVGILEQRGNLHDVSLGNKDIGVKCSSELKYPAQQFLNSRIEEQRHTPYVELHASVTTS